MITLETLMPSDRERVEILCDLAFGPARRSLSSYRLREGCPDIACLALKAIEQDGTLCGTIRFWPIRIGRCLDPVVLLGPVAVHPTRHGEGIGHLLITEGVRRAKQEGYRAILLVGDEPYFGRFGFRKAPAIIMPPPTSPERTLLLELATAATAPLSGSVQPWNRGGEATSQD